MKKKVNILLLISIILVISLMGRDLIITESYNLRCEEIACPTSRECTSYLITWNDCIINCYNDILYYRVLCIEFP